MESTSPKTPRSGPDWPFVATAVAMVALALIPYPGAFKLLQQILPIALIFVFYRKRGYSALESGLAAPERGWLRLIALALPIALALYFAKALTLGRLLHALFPEGKDLSAFDALHGNLANLLVYLAFMWLLAAFGEELMWRGFLLRELGERNGGPLPWLTAVLVSALFFGLAHAYQGAFGVVEKVVGATIMGGIYVWSGRSSIWLVVLIHGFQNTLSFVALYLGVYEQLNFYPR